MQKAFHKRSDCLSIVGPTIPPLGIGWGFEIKYPTLSGDHARSNPHLSLLFLTGDNISLALPDPFCTGAYRLEIISATLRESGTVHSITFLTLNK